MIEKDYTVEERFYQSCAQLLNSNHDYRPFHPRKRNRWTNREPGNGRFPGHGCVRMFGPNSIHVMLTSPKINRFYNSCDAALAGIRKAIMEDI